MYSSSANMQGTLDDFQVEGMMMRYSQFVPKLYNYCKSLGFEPGMIMPSRAFCSDESQGFPIILITKHFGTFPFNHGQVGGIVATDRHGPHAHHGKHMVIIQASHVGYDPATRTFGTYRRLQCEHHDMTPSCGKIDAVLSWYLDEYSFAQENILLERVGGEPLLIIDNQLTSSSRSEGLFLELDRLVHCDRQCEPTAARYFSTAKAYRPSAAFLRQLGESAWPENGREALGTRLSPDLFRFQRKIADDVEGREHLERNLIQPMPWIVTSPSPLLTAAQINTQVEFDRAFRSIVKEHNYRGKNVVYVAGLNIDIAPEPGQLFPLTKFVPWAAYVQREDGSHFTLEQEELMARLREQGSQNPDQIDLEQAIHQMEEAQEIRISL
jgi:hypothetical protein